jgi:hypothetical protein
VDQAADVGFPQRGGEERFLQARPDLQLEPRQCAHRADFKRERFRQRDRRQRGELGCGEATRQTPTQAHHSQVHTDQIDRSFATRPCEVHLPLEDRQREPHTGHRPDSSEERFGEPFGSTGVELHLGAAEELGVQLCLGASEAGSRDLRGQEQCHTDRDPDDRKALLDKHGPRPQPRFVDVADPRQAHPRHRQAPGPLGSDATRP